MLEINSQSIKELDDNGIIKLKNFLNSDELKQMTSIISSYAAPKNHPNSYFANSKKKILGRIIKLNFSKIRDDLKILNLARNKNLEKIADKILDNKSYLRFVDGYCTPISDKDLLPWHTDQAYQGDEKNYKNFANPDHAYLKIFIYLTDTGPDNGCMSYIPQSHKIGYALRKGIYDNDLKYMPYYLLKELRTFVLEKKNNSYIVNFLNDKNIIKEFLDKTSFVEKRVDCKDFDYYSKAGDAIIFNELGVHKASKTLYSERMVLRYLYTSKKNIF